MPIYALNEGTFSAERGGLIRRLNPATDNSPKTVHKMGITPFLLCTSAKNILFDCGLGLNDDNGLPTIYNNLRQHQISPEQITHVIFSHLHHDHVGGSVRYENGHFQLAFPNALHYICRPHLHYAVQSPDMPALIIEKIRFLLKHAAVIFIQEKKGVLEKKIFFEITHGHCPFHMSLFFRDERQHSYFFGGDELPMRYQLLRKVVAKYDQNPQEAARLREKWHEAGRSKAWTFLLYHEYTHPIFTL